MSRYIGDGYVDGQEKIQIIPDKGSSIGVQDIEKPLVICKKCRGNITENNAMMPICKPWPYLVHTNCVNDCNKCPLCEESAHYVSVKLIPVRTEKKQSKWRKIFKKAGR
ncbi:uncharacterized protein LOC116016689 [Ipomoea triloba]|uniref:uncharacterized protein LOC116016689 n=1 Tax=Ipomoea triloba TaxID=35885 RepID=UPI00125DA526|nr:uncharacterized protein LOC116016689 [Ipomoea triloba]